MVLSEEHLQTLVVVLSVPIALSHLWIAVFLPPKLRVYLSRRRLRWIERCRALYSTALENLQHGDRLSTEDLIVELEKWQARWEARQTLWAKTQRAFWVVLAVWIVSVMIELSPFFALTYFRLGIEPSVFTDFHFMAVYTGGTLLIVLSQYFLLGYDEDPMAGDDFAGRLRRALDAGEELVEGRYFPTLDDIPALRLLFGLSGRFTKKELDKARRRLAAELHPDRWSDLPEQARQTREERLKHVNAAYERMRPLASDAS